MRFLPPLPLPLNHFARLRRKLRPYATTKGKTVQAMTASVFSVPPSGLEDVTVTVLDRMEPFRDAWKNLERDECNSLHQSYDWCAAWVKTHDNPLAILHGQRGGQTVFILPLEIARQNMVRVAQFIAGRFSNLNTGLFDPGFRDGLDEASAQQLGQRIAEALRERADLICLQNMPAIWRGKPMALHSLPSVENQNRAFQLPLSADFEETLQQLNAKRRRKKFRQQTRRLEAMGGYDHMIARSTQEKHALLDLFFSQKAVRFKALGLPNVFQPAQTQGFFHMLLESGAPGLNVPLELHGLRLKGEHDGHIAAIAGLSRKGEHVICQFGSIDETIAGEASPGELLFWHLIERACAEGATLFDFGIGDQAYKHSWCTQETAHYDVLLPVTGLGRLAALAQRGVTRTKAAIKANPQIYGFVQRLRASVG